jgi:hypothetical protein
MPINLWKVIIFDRWGEADVYKVSAKDDVAARAKAVALHIKKVAEINKKAKAADKKSGELNKAKDAYTFTEKDIKYCNVEFMDSWE